MSNQEDLESTLLSILQNVENSLPESDRKNIRELIENLEWGIGLEVLCTQLDEYDVPISHDTYISIKDVGQAMGLSPSLWTRLLIDNETG